MSIEVPYPTHEYDSKLWEIMDGGDPIHGKVYWLGAVVLGFGSGFAAHEPLSNTFIDAKNDVYEAQIAKIDELEAEKASVDTAHQLLINTGRAPTLGDLEEASSNYKQAIIAEKAQLPSEYHPNIDAAISQGGSIAVGLFVIWSSSKYFARKISESRQPKLS